MLDDPMVFLAPAGSPESERQSIGMAEIAHLPMIGTRDPGCRQIIDDAFHPAELCLPFRQPPDHPRPGRLRAGLAVLPMLAVDENDPKVAVIPIRPAPPPRRLGIAWHPERRPPPSLVPFIEAAAEVCRDLDERWTQSDAA